MNLGQYTEVARLVPEKKDGLLPCPFCGDEVELAEIRSHDGGKPFKIWHGSGICPISESICGQGYKKDQVIELWNFRAIDSLTPLLELEVGIDKDKLLDIIEANKVDEVMTIDIKTVSDIKEFFNQHLDRVYQAIASSNVIEIRSKK